MTKTRKLYEPWLRDYLRKRQPRLEADFLRAIDAYDAIVAAKTGDETTIAPLVRAASSSRRPLFVTATELLGKLSAKDAVARKCIEKMLNDSQSHVRYNAVLCLAKGSPRAFKLRVLRQALQDKSSSVRQKAADWALRLRFREVVPDLETALVGARAAPEKRTVDFCLRLLRDGYILEKQRDGSVDVTAISKYGGIGTQGFEKAEVKRRGIAAIVREMENESPF